MLQQVGEMHKNKRIKHGAGKFWCEAYLVHETYLEELSMKNSATRCDVMPASGAKIKGLAT